MGIKAGNLKSEVVKETDKYTILKKRSGRHSVLGADKKYINGEEKLKILVDEGILKIKLKPKEEPAAEEPAAEAAAEAKAEDAAEATEEKKEEKSE